MQELKFDDVIHLAGEQVIPNYMAIKLTECKRHLFFVTDRTEHTISRLRNTLNGQGVEVSSRLFPATDYAQMMEQVRRFDATEYQGRKVGINLTGGTKLMFAAALKLSEKCGFVPFYIDTEGRKIQFLCGDVDSVPMPTVFSTVAEYFNLAGYEIGNPGRTVSEVLTIPKRRLLRLVWQYRELMCRVVEKFAEASDRQGNRKLYAEASDVLEGLTQRYNTGMLWSEWACCRDEDDDWKKTARLGGGVWLEEWLMKMFDEGKSRERLVDIRTGLSVRAPSGENDMQEIDITFTDGYRLYLMECKAGKVIQEHVQKLENLRRGLGGAFGVAVLCSLNSPTEALRERIALGTISLVADEALPQLPQYVFKVVPGRCYTKVSDFGKC